MIEDNLLEIVYELATAHPKIGACPELQWEYTRLEDALEAQRWCIEDGHRCGIVQNIRQNTRITIIPR